MLNDFYLLNDKSTNIAFHIPSSKLIKLTKFGFDLISELKSGITIDQLSRTYSISTEEISLFIDNLNKAIPVQENPCIEINAEKKFIDRVTVHVANDCNLRCSYCYASGGNYKMDEKMMNSKTADDLVLFLSATFDRIGDLVFFGGEPLLNYDIIKRICQNFRNRVSPENLPRFNLITNGTIINDDIIDIINNHIHSVVVSIDGPPEANDLHRKYKNGGGSYSRIEVFIKTLKEKTKADVKFEATYTKEHSEMGYSKDDISSFLKEHFRIFGSVIEEMMRNDEGKNKKDSNTLPISKRFLESGGGIQLNQNNIDILLSIAKNSKRFMCPAGKNTVAISVDGGISLCHVLINEPKYSLGSIYTDNIFTNKDKYNQIFPFLKSFLKENEPCLNCWAINLCGGCILQWFYNFKDRSFSSIPKPHLCDKTKEYLEFIILNLSIIQGDSEAYNSFLENLKREVRYELC